MVVITDIKPYAGYERQVAEALFKAVTFVRLEAGCQRCELHEAREGGASLVLVERWSCSSAWLAHQLSAASQALSADIVGIADLTVRQLKRLA